MKIKSNIIYHNSPTIGFQEKIATISVLNSSRLRQGNKVLELENRFSEYLEVKPGSVVAVSSGTAALYLAARALEISGSNVGIPSYTCPAVRNAIELAQGQIHYLDNSKNEPCIDIANEELNDLRFLVLVHTFGIPVGIPSRLGLDIIEDFSQAIGGRNHEGKYLGTLGKIGIASLSATKLITSGGQGGIIVSQDTNLIEEILDFRDFDMRHDKKIRFNFEMTEIQAAICLKQLEKIEKFIEKREVIFEVYQQTGLNLLSSYKRKYGVKYRAVILNDNAISIKKYLQGKNIKTIIPIEYDELLDKSLEMSNAIDFSKKTLSLPIYPRLKIHQAKFIAKEVKKLVEL